MQDYYGSLDAVEFDCNLVYSNCSKYNRPGSAIVVQARQISDMLVSVIKAASAAVTAAEDSPSTSTSTTVVNVGGSANRGAGSGGTADYLKHEAEDALDALSLSVAVGNGADIGGTDNDNGAVGNSNGAVGNGNGSGNGALEGGTGFGSRHSHAGSSPMGFSYGDEAFSGGGGAAGRGDEEEAVEDHEEEGGHGGGVGAGVAGARTNARKRRAPSSSDGGSVNSGSGAGKNKGPNDKSPCAVYEANGDEEACRQINLSSVKCLNVPTTQILNQGLHF